jgi:non-ribosomal peptide synthetase component E (peptide arylation enzyme)
MGYVEIKSTRDMWENNLPRFPRKTAVVDGDVTLSFAEANEKIERLRTAFVDRLGIRQHENIAVLLPNCCEFFLV